MVGILAWKYGHGSLPAVYGCSATRHLPWLNILKLAKLKVQRIRNSGCIRSIRLYLGIPSLLHGHLQAGRNCGCDNTAVFPLHERHQIPGRRHEFLLPRRDKLLVSGNFATGSSILPWSTPRPLKNSPMLSITNFCGLWKPAQISFLSLTW